MTNMTKIFLAMLATEASAQQRAFYDSSGSRRPIFDGQRRDDDVL